MKFRYSMASVDVNDTKKSLLKNQDNIWKTISPHLKEEFRKIDILPDLMGRIVTAAEFTIGGIYNHGPDKKDAKWGKLIKQITKTYLLLSYVDEIELNFLDAELRRQDWFKKYCENHTTFFSPADSKYIETNQIKKIALHSLMEFRFLLEHSLKGNKVGGKKTNDDLVAYCLSLKKEFEKYTDKKFGLNGPFEKFCDECIKPFRNTSFKEYADSSANNAIRTLQLKFQKKV